MYKYIQLLPNDIIEHIISYLDIDTKRIIKYYKKIIIPYNLTINFRLITHGVIDRIYDFGYLYHVYYIELHKYKLSRSIKFSVNGNINIYYNMIVPSIDSECLFNDKCKYLKSTVKDNLTYNLLEVNKE